MRDYWRSFEERWSKIDYERDPDGIGACVAPGQPHWYGKAQARIERRVFAKLLSQTPPPGAGARALDIGCGAGRWSRLLAERGYATTGIDLQMGLVEDNRRRFPHIEFRCLPIQEFPADDRFDVVASVLVLQHITYAEQEAVVRRLHDLLRAGGHAVILECVRYDAPHFFPREPGEWVQLFRRAGFRVRSVQPYNFLPTRRALLRLRRGLRGGAADGEEAASAGTAATRSPLAGAVLRGAVTLDAALQPAFMRLGRGHFTHSGFLFQASGG